jgi:hypothetical protein
MTYKCLECGHIFEEGEEATWEEDRGEYWGTPCTETVCGCPLCKGDYEETTPCLICGSEHLHDEMTGDICESCLTYADDFDTCIEIGEKERENVKINSLLATFFEPCEIDDILAQYIEDYHLQDEAIQRFIKSDEGWFGEQLAELIKNRT